MKTRMQAGTVTSLLGGVKDIFASEGIGGFFAGYSATLLRDVPYTMLELGLYENIKILFKNANIRRDGGDGDLTQNQELISGAITGAVTGLLTTPLDVVKTKIMMAPRSGPGSFGSLGAAFSQVYADLGPGGMFSGAGARVAWLLPFTTIYLQAYELMKKKLIDLKTTGSA
jgi:solute carrier family 25 S-adenosylmethionine transporter 26